MLEPTRSAKLDIELGLGPKRTGADRAARARRWVIGTVLVRVVPGPDHLGDVAGRVANESVTEVPGV